MKKICGIIILYIYMKKQKIQVWYIDIDYIRGSFFFKDNSFFYSFPSSKNLLFLAFIEILPDMFFWLFWSYLHHALEKCSFCSGHIYISSHGIIFCSSGDFYKMNGSSLQTIDIRSGAIYKAISISRHSDKNNWQFWSILHIDQISSGVFYTISM